jgi:hypothetical protein
MILIRAVSEFRLLSDFLLLSPAPPNDPARTAAMIASNRRLNISGPQQPSQGGCRRLDQEIVSGLPMSLKRLANIRTYAQRPALTFKPCVSAVHILCTE